MTGGLCCDTRSGRPLAPEVRSLIPNFVQTHVQAGREELAPVVRREGYTTLAPGWPYDPDTVEVAKQDPQVFAHKRIRQVTDHYVDAIGQIKTKPPVIGHSFGGLIAQQLEIGQ